EGGFGDVHRDVVGETGDGGGVVVELAAVADLGHLLQGDGIDPVDLATLEGGHPALVDAHAADDDLVEVGFAFLIVLVPAGEGEVVVGHPFDEFEGAGADGVAGGIVGGDGFLVEDLAETGEGGEEGTGGGFQGELDGVDVDRIDGLDDGEAGSGG